MSHIKSCKLLFIISCTFVLGFSINSWSVTSEAATEEEQPSITVSGKGIVSGVPTKVRIQASVITLEDSPSKSIQLNNEIMERVFDTLKNHHDIGQNNIQTSNIGFSPKYRYNNSNSNEEFLGYETSNAITIVVRAIDQVGNILDDMVKVGVTKIGGIHFIVENLVELKNKAQELAMGDAIQRARRYASAGKFKLGPIIEVREGTSHKARGPSYGFGDSAERGVPIAGGETTYTSAVTVIFSIVPNK